MDKALKKRPFKQVGGGSYSGGALINIFTLRVRRLFGRCIYSVIYSNQSRNHSKPEIERIFRV